MLQKPAILMLLLATVAQAAPPAPSSSDASRRGASQADRTRWRNADLAPKDREPATSSADTRRTAAGQRLQDVPTRGRRPIARVSTGDGTLPNEHGQIWREYDIRPYTLRVTSTNRPEQAIVDWVLRETGYEAWHSEPLAILSPTRRTLRVYHTPEMQRVVGEIVDRFVNSEAETHAFSVRVVTVGHPNWRTKVYHMLRPVEVQTPGVQAWLTAKENASMLLNDLRKRTDFREHSSPHLLVNNGQSTVVAATRSRPYTRDVLLRPDQWPGFEVQMGQIDEGFSIELSPLLSLDGRMIDAVLKCNIDQVEKLVPVMIDVPTPTAPRQRVKIEVPQTAQCRFQERFRWPTESVLIIGLGMVPSPVPNETRALPLPVPLPLASGPPRSDLLVIVESKGKSGEAPTVTRNARRGRDSYRGRY